MTPKESIDYFMAQMPDNELLLRARTCELDLHKAAEDENNSEWHGACFAAMVTFCQELNRRGLKINNPPQETSKPCQSIQD